MELQNYKPKISPRNKVFADKVKKYADEYDIVGVVDVTGLPTPQFQRIRATISKTAKVLIVKKNIIELVLEDLEKSKPGIKQLIENLNGVVGLVFTNDNPFTLYKFIKKNKSSAPAKAGQSAPNDIVVPAGPTSFAPGPIIGELGALKIKAGINAGKVEIKEDAVVAKEGEEISEALAGILSRLGIEPMEVGLNIKSVYEAGTIYKKSVLDVDEDEILAQLRGAASDSFKLSIGLDYYTSENISHFLTEAGRDSLGLGVGIVWPSAQTIKRLLTKANSQGVGLGSTLPEDIRPAGMAVAAPVAAETSSAANEESASEEKKEEPEADAASGLGDLF